MKIEHIKIMKSDQNYENGSLKTKNWRREISFLVQFFIFYVFSSEGFWMKGMRPKKKKNILTCYGEIVVDLNFT